MEINAESVLDALNDFERKPSEIPPILEDYLLRIAQNGEIVFPWAKLKPLLKRKLEVVLDEFYETCRNPVEIVPNFESFNFDSLKKTILQAVEAFTSAPFTIQRICELITNPKKHYNRTDKYMRGIEKNVLVVSTIEPRIGVQNDANANVGPIVNGMIGESPHDDNECFNGHENNENEPSNNLNTPANHVLLDNFANVFPSAACIPSPSNICINREVDSLDGEIDSNFIPSTADSVEIPEAEFGPEVAMESEENIESEECVESKEEQMDTTTEEQENCKTEESCEVSTSENKAEDAPEIEDQHSDTDEQVEEEQDSKRIKLDEEKESVDNDITLAPVSSINKDISPSVDADLNGDIDTDASTDNVNTDASADINTNASADINTDANDDVNAEDSTSVDSPASAVWTAVDSTPNTDADATADVADSASVSSNVKHEADCSESISSDSSVEGPEIENKTVQLQQDDTVSQSDSNTNDSVEVSQSDDSTDMCEAQVADDTQILSSDTTEVSQSVEVSDSSDSSGQCMELESSTEEPCV